MWLLKPFTRKQKTLTSIQMLGCDNHKPILGTEDQWGSRFFVWKLSCKFMAAPVSPNNCLSAKIFFPSEYYCLNAGQHGNDSSYNYPYFLLIILIAIEQNSF